jgi:hypothetical protein
MNAHDTTDRDRIGSDCNLFNRATLELTFKILRERQPALALQIQNTLVSIYPRNDYHTAFTALELPLRAETINEIAQALLMLSEELLITNHLQRTDLIMVRSLLLDWLMLAHECAQPAA